MKLISCFKIIHKKKVFLSFWKGFLYQISQIVVVDRCELKTVLLDSIAYTLIKNG